MRCKHAESNLSHQALGRVSAHHSRCGVVAAVSARRALHAGAVLLVGVESTRARGARRHAWEGSSDETRLRLSPRWAAAKLLN